MWIDIKKRKPHNYGAYACFGNLDKGTPFESRMRFTAFWEGKVFTDKDGEDLTGLNDSVEFWWSFEDVSNPD